MAARKVTAATLRQGKVRRQQAVLQRPEEVQTVQRAQTVEEHEPHSTDSLQNVQAVQIVSKVQGAEIHAVRLEDRYEVTSAMVNEIAQEI